MDNLRAVYRTYDTDPLFSVGPTDFDDLGTKKKKNKYIITLVALQYYVVVELLPNPIVFKNA